MTEAKTDNRKFSRLNVPINARLKFSQHEEPVTVYDISLKGALISSPSDDLQIHDPCVLSLQLNDSNIIIEMSMLIVHQTGCNLGLQCDYIDIDSIAHLRRLIELNSESQACLERELSELTQDE